MRTHPRALRISPSLACLGAALAACGGSEHAAMATDASADDGTDATDATADAATEVMTDAPEATPDATSLAALWCEPYAAHVCARIAACGCTALAGYPADLATCEAELAGTCATRVGAIGPGFVTHPENVDRCLQVLDEALATCALPAAFVFSVECVLATTPAGIGAACSDGLCADGAGVCGPTGRCAALPGEGAPCANSLCTKGLRCALVPGADAPTCETPGAIGAGCDDDGACASPLQCLGGHCGASATALGATCTHPGPCDALDGTWCIATMARRCVAGPGLGEACEGDGCPANAFCDQGRCAARPGRDAPCGDGVYCADGLACDFASGHCASIPGAGERCALGSRGPFVCAAGLACDAAAGTCASLPGEGAPCAQGSDGLSTCAAGLGCDFQRDGQSICRPKVAIGQACTNDTNCSGGAYCEFSELVCRPYRATDEACADGNECGPQGSCVAPTPGGAYVCRPLPTVGEACAGDCTAGLVCEGVATEGRCAPPVCTTLPF